MITTLLFAFYYILLIFSLLVGEKRAGVRKARRGKLKKRIVTKSAMRAFDEKDKKMLSACHGDIAVIDDIIDGDAIIDDAIIFFSLRHIIIHYY